MVIMDYFFFFIFLMLSMKTLDVYKCTSSENRGLQIGCTKQIWELFSHEHQSEVLWVYLGKALIPLFGVDVPSIERWWSAQGLACRKERVGDL